MKNMKCFFLILVLIAGLCTPTLGVYAEAETVQEEPKSFTEGADTAVTITSYTDFDEESACFLKEGDQIAVLSPSALPSKRQVEMTCPRESGVTILERRYEQDDDQIRRGPERVR